MSSDIGGTYLPTGLDCDRSLSLQDAVAGACIVEQERTEAHLVANQRLLCQWVGVITAWGNEVRLERLRVTNGVRVRTKEERRVDVPA